MHLIFFDEAKPQNDYPFYHIGAICVSENHVKDIENEVNTLSKKVFDEVTLKQETEFKGHNLFHKKAQFKNHDVADRIDILISLAQILSKNEIHLIDIQINVSNLYVADYAKDYAFMFLCEKVDTLLSELGAMGILIGDRENEQITNRFSVALSEYRSKGTEYQFRTEIKNIFESVHFTPSHLSRFLQLADIYTWICQYKNKHKKGKNLKDKRFLETLNEVKLLPKRYKVWPSS